MIANAQHVHPVAVALAGFLATAPLVAGPSIAGGTGPWVDGDRSSARLIAEGVNAEGTLLAGIEIELPHGWKTYWSSPGDAGIEPLFDFTGSVNVEDIRVAFPTPVRDDDGYAISNVYKNGVLFPLTATVPDPDAPVHLVADLQYGVCEVVCVSDHVSVELDVLPGVTDINAARYLARAREALPGAPQEGVFDVTAVWRDGGTDKRPVYVFTVYAPSPEDTVVFVDGPDGWYPATPKLETVEGSESTWRVKFSRAGSKVPLEDAAFTVVLSAGGASVEQEIAPEDSGS